MIFKEPMQIIPSIMLQRETQVKKPKIHHFQLPILQPMIPTLSECLIQLRMRKMVSVVK